MVPFVCLMYHALEDAPRSQYSLGFREFERQLQWLVARHYTIEGFRELELRLQTSDFPSNYVVMSFDDGHESGVRAAELVRGAGGQATFFLTKNFCEQRSDYLKPNAIRRLAELCSIGSHGVSHTNLARLDGPRLSHELSGSRRWLEEIVGREITWLSAPGGFLSSRVLERARDAGYGLVGNSVEWWNEEYRLRTARVVNRVAVRSTFSPAVFARIMRRDALFFAARRARSAVLEIPKRLLSQSQLERLSVFVGKSQRPD